MLISRMHIYKLYMHQYMYVPIHIYLLQVRTHDSKFIHMYTHTDNLTNARQIATGVTIEGTSVRVRAALKFRLLPSPGKTPASPCYTCNTQQQNTNVWVRHESNTSASAIVNGGSFICEI